MDIKKYLQSDLNVIDARIKKLILNYILKLETTIEQIKKEGN